MVRDGFFHDRRRTDNEKENLRPLSTDEIQHLAPQTDNSVSGLFQADYPPLEISREGR